MLDNFIRKERIDIDYQNEYGNYERLSFATLACQNDTECIGVFEAACDRDGPFTLVKKGFYTPPRGYHCIYNKKESQGRYAGCTYVITESNSTGIKQNK